MSWYSDKEKFDEYDPDWCIGCTRDTDYYKCKRCCELHEELDIDEDEDDY